MVAMESKDAVTYPLSKFSIEKCIETYTSNECIRSLLRDILNYLRSKLHDICKIDIRDDSRLVWRYVRGKYEQSTRNADDTRSSEWTENRVLFELFVTNWLYTQTDYRKRVHDLWDSWKESKKILGSPNNARAIIRKFEIPLLRLQLMLENSGRLPRIPIGLCSDVFPLQSNAL